MFRQLSALAFTGAILVGFSAWAAGNSGIGGNGISEPTNGNYSASYNIVNDWSADPTGAVNISANINARILALSAAGGGTVTVPAGTFKWAPVLASNVRVEGVGQAASIICPSSPCVTQNNTVSLAHAAFEHVKLKANSVSDTAISLTSVQQSNIGDISVSGFTSGTIFSLVGVYPTTISDTTLGANIIFNVFHDITAFDGSTNGMVVKGAYGAGVAPSPIGVGGMVVTQNEFRNFNLAYTGKCVDIIADTDTNYFYNTYCRVKANNGVFVVQGDDAVYSGQNVYVDNNYFYGFAFSSDGLGETGVVGFGGDYSFGTEAYGINSDIPYANFTLSGMTNDKSHCFIGGGLDPALATSLPLIRDCYQMARRSNTFSASPSTGFVIASSTTTGTDEVWLTNGSLLATGQIQFPCSAQDGDFFNFGSLNGVTTFTPAICPTSSDHLQGFPTTLAAGTVYRFRYIKVSGFWVPN